MTIRNIIDEMTIKEKMKLIFELLINEEKFIINDKKSVISCIYFNKLDANFNHITVDIYDINNEWIDDEEYESCDQFLKNYFYYNIEKCRTFKIKNIQEKIKNIQEKINSKNYEY